MLDDSLQQLVDNKEARQCATLRIGYSGFADAV
jgi:hypothetical protein